MSAKPRLAVGVDSRILAIYGGEYVKLLGYNRPATEDVGTRERGWCAPSAPRDTLTTRLR